MTPDVNGQHYETYKTIILFTVNLPDAIDELRKNSAVMIKYWGVHNMALVYLSMPCIDINFKTLRPIPEIFTDENKIINAFLNIIGLIDVPDITLVEKNCTHTELITRAQLAADNMRVCVYRNGEQALQEISHTQ